MKPDIGKPAAYAMLAAAVLIWGAAFPVTKYALHFLPPFMIAFLRYGVAAALFLPFLRGSASIRRGDRASFLALGLSGSLCFVVFMNTGLRFTSGVSGAFLSGAPPLLTVPLAALFLGEKLGVRKALGLLIGLAGVLVVAGAPLGSGEHSLRMVGGNLLILCSLLSWVTYTLIGRRMALRYSGELLGAWTTLIGSLSLLPLAAAETGWERGYAVTGGCFAALLYLAVLNTAVAYLFWNRALNVVGASTAAGFQLLQPLSGALVAVLLLGEKPDLALVIGAALILVGVWQIVRAEQQAVGDIPGRQGRDAGLR